MKKILTLLLSALIFCTSLVTLIACGGKKGKSTTGPSDKEGNYLALNAYEITLELGETFALDAMLYDENDAQQTVQEMTYTVDVEKVADVKDGLITAKQEGTTYINVYADGVSASCFLTVVSGNVLDGLIIRFTTQKLYQGVSQQAHALLYDNGTLIAEPTVEWSVSDAETLELTANGMVTPKLTGITTITATCEYEGETYTAEKQITVVEPIYYAFSKSNVKLASPLTLSGAENAKHITNTKDIVLNRVNLVTREAVQIPVDDYTVAISDAEVATSTATETGVKLEAKKVGNAMLTATLSENGEMIIGKIQVAYTIASVADMDVLALASWNDSSLLKESFLMVNDIDYKGDVMMPIAAFNDNVKARSLGIQWKYRLKKTGDNYEFLRGEDFGKKDTGLSDEEFATLNSVGGLNKNNAASFSGTFDGNGYSIKNGELFYGVVTINTDADMYYATYSQLFGKFTGTLKNVSFENIGMQNPKDVTIEGVECGIDVMYINSTTILENGLKKTTNGGYYHRGASIIAYGDACVVENVYVEMRETEVCYTSPLKMGALICWAKGNVYVANCVADIQLLKEDTRTVCMIKGTGDAMGTYENILAISHNSTDAFNHVTGVANLGFNGNYWNKTTDWKTLFTLTAGAVETARSIEQTVSTYNPNIWDMNDFGADKDGRPKLIPGCSV